MLLKAYVDLSNPKEEAVWFLNSCCSNHMIRSKHWFIQFDPSFRQDVKLSNNTKIAIMGKGSSKIQVNITN